MNDLFFGKTSARLEIEMMPGLQTKLRLHPNGDYVLIRYGLPVGRIWIWPEELNWSTKRGDFGLSLKEFRWVDGKPERNRKQNGAICVDVKSLLDGCLLVDEVFEDLLIANIKLANNGYLRTDCMSRVEVALATAMAKSGRVVFKNGLVHLPETKPEFFQTPYPVHRSPLIVDGPDYEQAILNRQEASGVYD